ncbi:MAG: arylsulfatase [Bacteroidota bacterium]
MIRKNNSGILIILALAGILAISCNPEESINTDELPNIIVVLADDLGYGDLSSFNEHGGIETPHLDKMAAEGMRFTDAHTSSSVCTPTRYGLLTGRYNWRTKLKSGVLSGKSRALIPRDRTTVASMLKKSGYHTAFIGKWHLGWNWSIKNPGEYDESRWDIGDNEIDFSTPISRGPGTLGFDYSYGHSGSLDMAPYVYVENGKVTALPDRKTVNDDFQGFWREGPTGSDFIHEEVTPNFFGRSMDFIQQRAAEKKPFFLYLALPSPHTPILPTEAWQGRSGLNPYGDFVMMIDDYMGKLLEGVKQAGIEKNTLVFFTSDNGCSPRADFNALEEKGHDPSYIFRGHKADIFEGGHRVPFIVKWPARIKYGTVSDEIICTTDIFRTLASLTGYEVGDHEGEDSYDLSSLFDQMPSERPLREATVHHSINGSFAIRQGDWKLIMCPGSGGWSYPTPNDVKKLDSLPDVQLYNLSDDPGETSNLQASNKEKVSELKSLLTRYIQQGRSTPGQAQPNDSIDFEWHQLGFMHKKTFQP